MDAFHAEVLACHAGLKAAIEKGMSRIVVETDSMMLRSALKGSSFSLAPTGGLIHEIKVLVSSNLVSFDILYCPRVCRFWFGPASNRIPAQIQNSNLNTKK